MIVNNFALKILPNIASRQRSLAVQSRDSKILLKMYIRPAPGPGSGEESTATLVVPQRELATRGDPGVELQVV